MANFNKVILIGRLTRDPECRTFANGGKVAKFGFAVTNRKKNPQTGQWEDEPMFIDCEAFNRGEYGTLANIDRTVLPQGQPDLHRGPAAPGPVGRQDDRARSGSKHKIVVEAMQLLDPQAGRAGRTAARGQQFGRSRSDGAGKPSPADLTTTSRHRSDERRRDSVLTEVTPG